MSIFDTLNRGFCCATYLKFKKKDAVIRDNNRIYTSDRGEAYGDAKDSTCRRVKTLTSRTFLAVGSKINTYCERAGFSGFLEKYGASRGAFFAKFTLFSF